MSIRKKDKKSRWANPFSSISKSTVGTVRDMFQLLDHDGDGVLSQDDLKVSLNSLGQKWDTNWVNEMMKDFKSKRISQLSFITMFVNEVNELDDEQTFKTALKIIAGDKNGNIDCKNLLTVLKESKDDRLTDEEISQLEKILVQDNVDKITPRQIINCLADYEPCVY